jgi:rhodanese-related sulfurtransferase
MSDMQNDLSNTEDAVKATQSNIEGNVEAAKDNIQENVETAKDKLGDTVETAKDNVGNTVEAAKDKLEGTPSAADAIEKAKDKLPNITPVPPSLHAQATAHELKSRLEWGEPGLTILDARDRSAFDECHIKGAMLAPLEEFEAGNKFNMSSDRDIYIYGGSDGETATAANTLRQAGFSNVAELKGGLQDWMAIGGATEGLATQGHSPADSERNVVSRLQEFSKQKATEQSLAK